jgi:hypothetical protein
MHAILTFAFHLLLLRFILKLFQSRGSQNDMESETIPLRPGNPVTWLTIIKTLFAEAMYMIYLFWLLLIRDKSQRTGGGRRVSASTIHVSHAKICFCSTTPNYITTFNVFTYFWHENWLPYNVPTHSSVKLTNLCHICTKTDEFLRFLVGMCIIGRQNLVPKVCYYIWVSCCN